MIDFKERLEELYKRAKDGYYKDKPFQFSMDENELFYAVGLINEGRYLMEKYKLESLRYNYMCCEKYKGRDKYNFPILR